MQNKKLLHSNSEQVCDSQAPAGYNYFQIGCVFVKYGLFNITTFIQNLIYIRSGIILTRFYIKFSRQEHQIAVLYVSFNACDSQVSSYSPLNFSLQSL